jgi:uncharacterized NAD(P)/FAD-binding protein YdhS
MTGRPVVAVIGAGFSGLLTTLHLLADPDGPQVRLIERRPVFGRGLAYSTDNHDHLLNVRVGNMSAFPQQPEHFVRWLATHSGWSAHGSFVTRGVYGDYLQSLLRDALRNEGGRLLLEADEADRVERTGDRWRIGTAMGRRIEADALVLALGSPAPAAPAGLTPALERSACYVADPWRPQGLPDTLGSHVLLIGAGLTMIDVVLSLAQPDRRFTVISRRGLAPTVHATTPLRAGAELAGSPLEILRHLRRESLRRDWREVVDEMRGSVRPLWVSWSGPERRAFLRHLRPFWEAHRHRMAPPVARQIEAMRRSGDLTVHAGSIQTLTQDAGEARLIWRPRGSRLRKHLKVSGAVNCTGHDGDLRRSSDQLVAALLADKLIRPDPCGLGADVDSRSRLLDAAGAPTPGLYAVGPLTRGAFWEITSVPDIRQQAAEVGTDILQTRAGNRVSLVRE